MDAVNPFHTLPTKTYRRVTYIGLNNKAAPVPQW